MSFKNNLYRTDIYEYVADAPQNSLGKNDQRTFISPEDKNIISAYTKDIGEIVGEVQIAFKQWEKKIYSKFKRTAR